MEFNQNYNGLEKEHSAQDNKVTTKSNIDRELKEQAMLIINSAVAVNQYEAVWMRNMPDSLKTYLEDLGYKVKEVEKTAKKASQWIISWNDLTE